MPLNPSKVKDQIGYLSTLVTDKIIRVFQGSAGPGEWVSVNYTLAGFPYTVYFYRIAHGLPRPVFTELLWSTDNVTFVDGGANSLSGDVSISFSDNTYVYISSPSVVAPYPGTLYYKVICSWIDNYDSTNPFVESKMYRTKPFSLDSRLNYQKIYDQNILDFTGSATKSVSHDLGYAPNAKVFFEAFPGQVWPLNFGSATNPFLYDDAQSECMLFIAKNQIAVRTDFGSSTAGTIRAWYRIYYDAN